VRLGEIIFFQALKLLQKAKKTTSSSTSPKLTISVNGRKIGRTRDDGADDDDEEMEDGDDIVDFERKIK
jgi:hypothetical protein